MIDLKGKVAVVFGLGGDRFVGEQVQVDAWSQLADPLAAFGVVVGAVGGHHFVVGTEQGRHQRHAVTGPQRYVMADDRRLRV